MSDKEKIGGRAYSNGLKLVNSKYSVKAYYDQEDFLRYKRRKVSRPRFFKIIRKIPVLRGIILLIWAIGSFLKESVKKPKKYWLIILIIIVDVVFMYASASTEGSVNRFIHLIYYSLPIILIVIFWNFITEVLKYHGAEHKAVNYYENDCEGSIASYSRLHRRCGSNIVFYYLFITILMSFIDIPFNFFLQELLYLGLAYEAIQYTPDYLLFIPQFFQRIATREPEEKHIKAAELALQKLLKEGEYYAR
ncbi:MAG: DUF1385 domain-containing protein [Halanaerobiales bacterium]